MFIDLFKWVSEVKATVKSEEANLGLRKLSFTWGLTWITKVRRIKGFLLFPKGKCNSAGWSEVSQQLKNQLFWGQTNIWSECSQCTMCDPAVIRFQSCEAATFTLHNATFDFTRNCVLESWSGNAVSLLTFYVTWTFCVIVPVRMTQVVL